MAGLQVLELIRGFAGLPSQSPPVHPTSGTVAGVGRVFTVYSGALAPPPSFAVLTSYLVVPRRAGDFARGQG